MKKKLILITLAIIVCMACTACLMETKASQYSTTDNPTFLVPNTSGTTIPGVTIPPVTIAPPDTLIPPVTTPPVTTVPDEVPPGTKPNENENDVITTLPPDSIPEKPGTVPTNPPATQPHICKYTSQRIEPSCTKEGITIYTCDCGKTYTESIPQKKHEYQKADTVDSTCTKEGKVIYRCACGAEKYTSIEKIPHQYTESNRTAPTCNKEGKITYTCACGKTQTESIAKTKHQYELTYTQESTTTVQGKKVYTCNCGASYTEQLPLKPSAKDTDMCGPSLLNKPLPHGEHSEVVEQLFARIALKPNMKQSIALGVILCPDDIAMNTFWTWWNDTYRYAAYMYWYTSYRYDDPAKEDGFLIWGDEDVWAEEAAVHAEIYRILAELKIDNTVTQKEAIARINNYLCENRYYEYDTSKRDGSIYNSIFGKSGVCHNYAIAFQMLCLGAGIECHYYSSDTMNHAWNKVYFSDGSYYWVDACWNDVRYIVNGQEVETSVENGVSAAKVKELRSRYLLITTEQLLKDHSM